MMKYAFHAMGIASALLFTASAFAVDLKNDDSKKYAVKIQSGAATTSTSIEAHSTSAAICSKCTLVVEGAGSIEVSGSEVAVIHDSKLSKK